MWGGGAARGWVEDGRLGGRARQDRQQGTLPAGLLPAETDIVHARHEDVLPLAVLALRHHQRQCQDGKHNH